MEQEATSSSSILDQGSFASLAHCIARLLWRAKAFLVNHLVEFECKYVVYNAKMMSIEGFIRNKGSKTRGKRFHRFAKTRINAKCHLEGTRGRVG